MTSATTLPPSWGWGPATDKRVVQGEGLGSVSRQRSLLFSAFRRWQHIKTLKPDVKPISRLPNSLGYSVVRGAQHALRRLYQTCENELPQAIYQFPAVEITSSSGKRNEVHFPTPLKEQDATTAIKALEACAATAIANLRYGTESRKIQVDIDKVSAFLISAYVTTLDGMGKADPGIKKRIPGKHGVMNVVEGILWANLPAQTRT